MRLSIIMILTILILVNMVHASTIILDTTTPVIQGGSLRVQVAKYDPTPVVVGKVATIWIKAENLGIEPLYNLSFELKSEFPFEVIGESKKSFVKLDGLDDVVIEYKILVDKGAKDGDNEIKLVSSIDGAVYEDIFNITVSNEPDYAEVKVLYVDSEPKPYPGGKSTITVDVVNVAPGNANYIIIEAQTPVGKIERNKIFVGTLEPDDSDSVDFDVEVSNDIKPGLYPMNFTLIYKDEDYNKIIQKDSINIRVYSRDESIKQETPWWVYLILLIIVVIVVRYIIKRRKKKK